MSACGGAGEATVATTVAFRTAAKAAEIAASGPTICAEMKPGTSGGEIPAKMSLICPGEGGPGRTCDAMTGEVEYDTSATGRATTSAPRHSPGALARGEIDKEGFEERRQILNA